METYLDDFFGLNKIDRNIFYQVLLTLSEAVSNSIIHGNDYDHDKVVIIKSEWKNNCLSLTIEDEGNGFDVSKIEDPTSEKNILKENGRGLFLIRSLADEVNFYDRGRILELKFKKQSEY